MRAFAHNIYRNERTVQYIHDVSYVSVSVSDTETETETYETPCIGLYNWNVQMYKRDGISYHQGLLQPGLA